MSISIFPEPLASTEVIGTTTTQDLDREQIQRDILKQLKIANLHHALGTDIIIKESEV